jgi:hypothetical protein
MQGIERIGSKFPEELQGHRPHQLDHAVPGQLLLRIHQNYSGTYNNEIEPVPPSFFHACTCFVSVCITLLPLYLLGHSFPSTKQGIIGFFVVFSWI